MQTATAQTPGMPDTKISVRQAFGIDSDMQVPAYSSAERACAGHRPGLSVRPRRPRSPFSPASRATGASWSRAITAPASRRTSSRSPRASTGRACASTSTATSSRIDLIGKDAIVLKDGKQVTEFRDGILPWAYQNNVALVFDEYDAGRPGRDVRHPARAGSPPAA